MSQYPNDDPYQLVGNSMSTNNYYYDFSAQNPDEQMYAQMGSDNTTIPSRTISSSPEYDSANPDWPRRAYGGYHVDSNGYALGRHITEEHYMPVDPNLPDFANGGDRSASVSSEERPWREKKYATLPRCRCMVVHTLLGFHAPTKAARRPSVPRKILAVISSRTIPSTDHILVRINHARHSSGRITSSVI